MPERKYDCALTDGQGRHYRGLVQVREAEDGQAEAGEPPWMGTALLNTTGGLPDGLVGYAVAIALEDGRQAQGICMEARHEWEHGGDNEGEILIAFIEGQTPLGLPAPAAAPPPAG